MSKIISIENLSLSINKKRIFDGISFDICEKDLIAIVGPNGSGKTSLIKMILGFSKCRNGSISHLKEKFYGYVPQNFHPIESINITVLEFLKLTEINNLSLDDAINLIKIDKLLSLNLNSLSGGELRRVLMVKALLFSKHALFLDEPTCWLDKQSQKDFYSLISELNKMLSCAIILISHDPFFQDGFFSKIVKL